MRAAVVQNVMDLAVGGRGCRARGELSELISAVGGGGVVLHPMLNKYRKHLGEN